MSPDPEKLSALCPGERVVPVMSGYDRLIGVDPERVVKESFIGRTDAVYIPDGGRRLATANNDRRLFVFEDQAYADSIRTLAVRLRDSRWKNRP